MLKKEGIEKMYTTKCIKYMMAGYVIDSKNANTSFGGYVTAMVLHKGGDYIAVSLREENDWHNQKSDMIITVETVNGGWCVWLGKEENEILEEDVYYGVAEGVWTSDKAISDKACATRRVRMEQAHDVRRCEFEYVRYTSNRAKEIAVKVLKNHRGYKRSKMDDVACVERKKYGYAIGMWNNAPLNIERSGRKK